MPEIQKHPAGSFSWVELGTTDQAAAKRFYTTLFGWTAKDEPSDIGPYTIFELNGRPAAATYTLREDQRQHGVPPHWLLYVNVTNADNAARRATELGGTILGGPFDAGEHGRMAIIQDPTKAVFAIWQPKANEGIGVAGEDSTLCWADLNTRDRDRAAKFYSELFGWTIEPDQKDPSGYYHIKNGDEFIGGMPPAGAAGNTPPHWLAYFMVSSCDASSTKAKELGARLYMEPMSMENVGTLSVLADPQGAVFSLFESARKSERAAS